MRTVLQFLCSKITHAFRGLPAKVLDLRGIPGQVHSASGVDTCCRCQLLHAEYCTCMRMHAHENALSCTLSCHGSHARHHACVVVTAMLIRAVASSAYKC